MNLEHEKETNSPVARKSLGLIAMAITLVNWGCILVLAVMGAYDSREYRYPRIYFTSLTLCVLALSLIGSGVGLGALFSLQHSKVSLIAFFLNFMTLVFGTYCAFQILEMANIR